MPFLILKWIHILSAIVAVGSNVTYGVWLSRARRDPQTLPFTLATIKVLDNQLANPAYALLFITGLPMVYLARLRLTAPWLLAALVLYLTLGLLVVLGYSPTLRNQIRVLEAEGPASPAYQALAARGARLGMALATLAVVIVFLMVVKPGG